MRAQRPSLDYSPDGYPDVPHGVSWFSLVGGGTAWLLHLLASYVISEFGCVSGLDASNWLGISYVAWWLIVATVVTGALAAVACYASWRTGKLLRGAGTENAAVTTETQLFVARASLFLNAFFAFVIFMQGVPIFFFLPEC